MQVNATINLELWAEFDPADPSVGMGPCWTFEGLEIPGFTDEECEFIADSFTEDMKDRLLATIQKQAKDNDEQAEMEL